MATRNGFVKMVHTGMRSDGQPIYKDVLEPVVKLAEDMGYRRWDRSQAPIEAKEFDPMAAKLVEEKRLAKEHADIEKLQARIDRMLDLGYKPDIAVLRTLTDAQFNEQMAELEKVEGETEKAQAEKGKPGRKKATADVQGN